MRPHSGRQCLEQYGKAVTPSLWVIIDETMLHRRIGSEKVMYDQLTHLAQIAERARTTAASRSPGTCLVLWPSVTASVPRTGPTWSGARHSPRCSTTSRPDASTSSGPYRGTRQCRASRSPAEPWRGRAVSQRTGPATGTGPGMQSDLRSRSGLGSGSGWALVTAWARVQGQGLRLRPVSPGRRLAPSAIRRRSGRRSARRRPPPPSCHDRCYCRTHPAHSTCPRR